VATQNRRLTRGLDPEDKGVRCGNYLAGVRFELERLSWACGVTHPAKVDADMIEILEDLVRATNMGQNDTQSLLSFKKFKS